MKKLTLEEAEKKIRNYVTKKILLDSQERQESDDINKKYPAVYGGDNSERSKALDAHEKKWNKGPYTSSYYSNKLSDLVIYKVPICKSKRCCDNCGKLFCAIKNVVPDYTRFCHSWIAKPANNPFDLNITDMLVAAVNDLDLPVEEQIEIEVKKNLDLYKATLKKAEDEEYRIKGTTLPIPASFVKRCEDELKEIRRIRKEYRKEYNKCWEPDEEGILGLKTVSLNKEKVKQLNEKYKMCPVQGIIGMEQLSMKKIKSWNEIEDN